MKLHALGQPAQSEKIPCRAIDPVDPVRGLQGERISVADFLFRPLAGQGQGLVPGKIGVHRQQQGSGIRCRLYLLQRHRLVQGKARRPGPAQGEKRSPTAQRLPDVMAERADIRPLGAFDPQGIVGGGELVQ